MATNFSNPDSLDTLTGAVNQALIETGRFFRSSGSVQSQAQLKRGIPAAHEQFQSALDSLSEQIFLAKAFLERDYEAIRATHGEDQAATQDVTMAEETDTKHETEPAAPVPEIAPEPAPAEVATEPAPAAEQTAMDTEIKKEPEPQAKEPLPPAATEPSQPEEQPEKPVKTEKPEEAVPSADTTEAKAEPGANDGGGVNEFDLHLDLGDDEIGNRNFLSGSFGATATGDGIPDLDHSAATAGGDAFDMELQKVSGSETEQQQQQQQQPSQPEPQPPPQEMTTTSQVDGPGGEMVEDVIGPGESSFDDLFLDSENFGGEGDQGLLEGDGLMNMSELDDNWFT